MIAIPIAGAMIFIAGIVYLARAALYSGRLSDPNPNPDDTAAYTLEPPHRGPGFLDLRSTWPGHLLLVVGAVLLLLPLLL